MKVEILWIIMVVIFFPERWFDIVFVLRTNNTRLFDRLEQR